MGQIRWDMRQLSGYNLFGIFKQQYYMTDEMVDDFVGCGHNVTQSVYVTAHSFNAADGDEVMKPLGEVRAMLSPAVLRANVLPLGSEPLCLHSMCLHIHSSR